MAYDQNAPYQPPRRAYYGQAQPQAPVQSSYTEHQNNQYSEYNREQNYHRQAHAGYDERNGYDQYNDYGNDVYNEYDWQGGNGYNDVYGQDAYQQQRPQERGHGTQQERNYDSRYQQRGPRGSAGQNQHDIPRMRPPQERQGYQIQPENRSKQMRQPLQRDGHREDYGRPRTSGNEDRPRGPPQQDQFRGNVAGNTSMDSWKAQEKARLKASATSPDYLPQDNAFPKFGNKKERPGTADGQASARSSEDRRRPDSGRTDGRMPRPATSRGQSHDGESFQYVNSAHHRQSSKGRQTPADVSRNQPNWRSNETYSEDSRYQQQASNYHEDPINNQHDQNWPLSSHQSQETTWHAQRQGYGAREDATPNRPGQPRAYNQPEQVTRRGPMRGPPVVQSINTNVQQSRPSFTEHYQMSPADVVPRPATASGARSVPAPQIMSPLSHVPQSATIEGYATPKPWMQHTQTGSQDGPSRGHNGMGGFPQTREEEIEAEMPDFDTQSAAMHKRTRTVDRHLNEGPVTASAPPPMPVAPSGYDGYQGQPQQRQGQSLRPEPSSFGPGLQQSISNPEYVRQGTPLGSGQSHGGRQYRANEPQGHMDQGAQPVRPPYANRDHSGQSMDNTGQMPRRPGPPVDQRQYQQGSRNDGPRPPPHQGRPELDRNATGQSVWSDPGQQRAPSAPPMGQRRPPPQRMGIAQDMQDLQLDSRQVRNSNPDALPHHPTPVRPGLTGQGQSLPNKPVPVRSQTDAKRGTASAPQQDQSQQNSEDPFAHPVTREELDRLRAEVEANPHNPKRALILAKKLVEAATVLASDNGRLDQRAMAKNREKYVMDGYKRVKKLVGQGYPEAQFYLADCYGQGLLGLEADTKEAFNLYQAAAKQGHAQAAYRTAVCCEIGAEDGGGTRRDFPKAIQWYRRAAALGDAAAMFKLGAVLLKGLLGQPRNVGEAVTWLKRAAERADTDNPHALHEMATLYDSANTDPEVRNKVISDDKYALELFQRAGKLGYKYSQFRLGQAYEYGALGLPIDNRQSIGWYTKAAAQGEHQAELALSGWYLTGAKGILEHSDTEAYLWARKAAMSEPPLPKALFAMGYFTEQGIGCPASLEEARKWYGRAASQNFPKALERLEELKKSGGKKPQPANGRLTRKDQKRDEAECVLM